MRRYIHQLPNWSHFQWDKDALAAPLGEAKRRQGRLYGRMEQLGFPLREEAALRAMTADAVRTSAIEGEIVDPETVRSSLARRMGIDIGGLKPADRHVDGLVDMLLDATRSHDAPLTEERLFGWQSALFPTGRSGMRRIKTGAWRDDADGPMQVVSGPDYRPRIHFEAPSAAALPREMAQFLEWFNEPAPADPIVAAGIAHFWFVTIHPFEDGNGRIARAVADMALARSEASRERFYSMSSEIGARRKSYYDILEASQKGGLDITPWLLWFVNCLGGALLAADALLDEVWRKAAFWRDHGAAPLNERQRDMLNLLLDGFEGKLTSSKWARITKVSQDTASRDINGLVELGILKKEAAGGRSTSYSL
ncbi:MAG: Fic family protein [Parvularculaceae bacterium]